MRKYFVSLALLYAAVMAFSFGLRDVWTSSAFTPAYASAYSSKVSLRLERPQHVAQQVQSEHMQRGEMCFVGANADDAEYKRLLAASGTDDCGFVAGREIVTWTIPYNRGFAADCGLAAALSAFEQRLNVLALVHLGTAVKRIDHMGSYSCRNMYGGPTGRPSEHAHANAIDIGGFELEDGTSITVEDDWDALTPKGRFLSAIHDEACGIFRTVLSPDYNAAHHDHFHFDLGPYHLCR